MSIGYADLGHDPEVAAAIEGERRRQEDDIELIASENYTSPAVMAAQGCVMTNKYAEGLAGKRYYGGCEEVDKVERLAVERVKALFGAEAANVQPHSGSQANLAVYMAACKPGDRVLGMNLSDGGHLTHGSPVNFSGLLYEAHHYGVDPQSGRIDYDALATQARALQPRLIVCGASAYPRIIDFPRLRAIADSCGALLLADMAHIAGLVATGLHPNPVGHAHFVTSTTHKTLRGPRGGFILMSEEHASLINGRVFPGIQGGPLMHVIAAKAVAFREAATDSYRAYMGRVVENAQALAGRLVERGLSIVSGGTDNHLMLLDLTGRELTGKGLEKRLGRAGITVNKNTVPGETRSPFVTSGVRIGTPAVTSRGMGVPEMVQIADLIADIVENSTVRGYAPGRRPEALALARRFPVYPHLAS